MKKINVPHPYESQGRIRAYRSDEGGYIIRGKTYGRRAVLKEHGARWHPEGKYWTGTLEAAQAVNAFIMHKVRVEAHCHEPEKITIATHKEVECGYMQLGCSLCDTYAISGDIVKILEVLD